MRSTEQKVSDADDTIGTVDNGFNGRVNTGSQDQPTTQTVTAEQHQPLVYNPTINQQIRNRMLFRDANGVNFGKIYAKQVFAPTSSTQARESITNKGKDCLNSGENYSSAHAASTQESQLQKSRYTTGQDFKRSYIYNNAVGSDKKGVAERSARAVLHTTGDKFTNEINDYKIFLNDPEELPRLSILDNYKQITRIMTQQFIKQEEVEKKFRNRTSAQNEEEDLEFLKYQDERNNTLKMSTILKSLNSPKKKRKAIANLRQKAEDEARERTERLERSKRSQS